MKRHWFAISFHAPGESAEIHHAQGYRGYKDRYPNLNSIDEAKRSLGVPPDSIMSGLIYLGYKTKKEFEGIDPAAPNAQD